MKRYTIFTLLTIWCISVFAQVTTTPTFIQKGYKGEIVITFNPQEGNKGMVNAKACYAHTGLITAKSSSPSDWKYATPTWRGTDPKYKMTKAGQNWELRIPNIYTYYGCPESEEILQMAFVFNDGPNGTLEGKTAAGGDIFVELVEAGLTLKFAQPSNDQLVSAGETVAFTVQASEEADMQLLINETEVATAQGTTLNYSHLFDKQGDYKLICNAKTATEQKSATINISVMRTTEEKSRPQDKQEMGVYYDKEDLTHVTLVTYAASKTAPAKAVYVVGDFNNWTISADYQMYRDGNYFWLDINNLAPGREYAYQYWVIRSDGQMKKISDAYAHKHLHPDDQYEPRQLDPTLKRYPTKGDGFVSIMQTNRKPFQWSEATLNFKRPNKNNLVIYEMWVYDYTPERSIEGVRRRLDYLQNLGVNAIELMPICEFDGNYNWGYSPAQYFAPDKAYGTEEQIKTFIDECHQRGMAVIMDMVFNHATGQNPLNKLYPYGSELAQNPWFNATAPHGDNVYEDWNHDFEETRKMFTRVLRYWLTEFKVDGYRMDLSHGFCGENCNNLMNNIKHYYNEGVRAVSEDAYFILEHWGGSMGTQRPELIRNGMMCWHNINGNYSQAAMGKSSGDAFTDANRDGYVTYCESHDEERNYYQAKVNGVDAIKNDETARLSRVPLTMAFNVLLNGPQMIWQWNELGYDYSINSTAGSLSISSNNRTSKKEQPEKLGWLQKGLRMQQYQKVAQIIHLRTHLAPEIFSGDPVAANLNAGTVIKSITWGTGKDVIFVVGNFSPTQSNTLRLPDGSWWDYLQNTMVTTGIQTLAPGEVRIFTGRHYELPQIPDSYDFSTDIPNISVTETGIRVYPTATHDKVYIEQAADVEVYNLSGQTVKREYNVQEISLSGLQNGLYLLRLQSGEKQYTAKVIKK